MIETPEYYGCSDGGCVFGHPGGMHTNGGCICLVGITRYNGPDQMQRVRKGIRALQAKVKQLEAALEEQRRVS